MKAFSVFLAGCLFSGFFFGAETSPTAWITTPALPVGFNYRRTRVLSADEGAKELGSRPGGATASRPHAEAPCGADDRLGSSPLRLRREVINGQQASWSQTDR